MFRKMTIALGVALAAASAVDAQAAPPKFNYGTPNANAPGVVAVKNMGEPHAHRRHILTSWHPHPLRTPNSPHLSSSSRASIDPNGPTNPATPQMNTPINQTSMARLASVNSVDDWCTFGPPNPGDIIANVEQETVAYCTKARNNARVIPDGTLTAVHFIKTPLYVQVQALGDFTKIGFAPGDLGGELDPHGAYNTGNPKGGNVTSNVSGKDVFYQEWMNYVSANLICMRVCTAGTDIAPTSIVCQHTLDEVGCNFVMPGNYANDVFETCESDVAYPPGLYPQPDGSTSTFQQYFSSVATVSGATYTYVNGSPDQTTPTAAYSTPASSNCQPTSTIANKIASILPSSSVATNRSSGAAAATSKSGSAAASSSSTSEAPRIVPTLFLAAFAAAFVGIFVF